MPAKNVAAAASVVVVAVAVGTAAAAGKASWGFGPVLVDSESETPALWRGFFISVSAGRDWETLS
ncbi:MAG: hypothetical protein Phyf2KO_18920 [Phycisphaerales bacterium]